MLALPGIEIPPLSLRLRDNVWGLDVSTRRVSVGVLQARGTQLAPELGWFSLEVEQHGGGTARLAWLARNLPGFFERIAGVAAPQAVLAEQPFGQGKARPHPQSYFVLGVVLCSLHLAFGDHAPIETVEPGTWKSEAMGQGRGFAKKAEILAWAQSIGYPGDCPKCHAQGKDCAEANKAHDEADSIGVVTSAGVRWSAARSLR